MAGKRTEAAKKASEIVLAILLGLTLPLRWSRYRSLMATP